jgi:hypothetical protein
METSPAGEFLAAQNESKYIEAWTNSLTLRPMTPKDGTIDGVLPTAARYAGSSRRGTATARRLNDDGASVN